MKKLLIPSLLLLLLLSAGCTQQQDMERQVAEAEQIIVEKEQENVELQTALDQINTALLQVQDTLKTEQARNDAFSTHVVELELENSQLLGRVAALENTEIENSRLQGRISGLEALARLALGGRKPKTISIDNGPEFTSKHLDQWAYLNGVELDFSRPGKPTDNAMIEAFNARLRAECLNESWFLSLEDAREKIEGWRRHYNGERPHSALGNLAPEAFALLATAGLNDPRN